MAWIESHQSLARHRKTLAVMAELKVDRHKLIGHLHELWWWGLDNAAVDGALGHVSHKVLAEAAGWPLRGADRFVHALVSAGFMESGEGGYVLHDWEDYAGKLVDRRVANRARMRAARADHVRDTVHACVELPDQPDQPDRTNQPKRTGETPSGGPPPRNGRQHASAKPTPKSDGVIEAFREHKIDIVLSVRDHAAIKASNAEPGKIVEVYDAVARGEYGDDFMRRRLSVHEAIEWINGYAEWKLNEAYKRGELEPAQS